MPHTVVLRLAQVVKAAAHIPALLRDLCDSVSTRINNSVQLSGHAARPTSRTARDSDRRPDGKRSHLCSRI